MPDFTCTECGKSFAVGEAVLAKYPGWIPKKCLACKGTKGGGVGTPRKSSSPARAQKSFRSPSASLEENLTTREVLAKYHDGPKSGVFTDGAASPNPGPGGWGAVYVHEDRIIEERCGSEPHTTNNRMELMALRSGIALVPPGTPAIVYTDSQLCVNTFTKWAKGWAARNWRRKDGEIKNLELVQEIFFTLQKRPELQLQWIAAHNGQRYNEYADSLATSYRRNEK